MHKDLNVSRRDRGGQRPEFFKLTRAAERGLVMRRNVLKLIRNHPKTTALFLLLVVLAAGAAGTCYYARRQWRDAEVAVKETQYKDALQNLRRCLFFWPNDPQVHLLYARAARLSGDFETAEDHLNKCLKIQHGASDEVQLEFLLMRVQRGEVDEVAPSLMTLVDNQHPESEMILETCAGAYMYNHRYRPALKCLNRWIQEVPGAARAFQWRGWVYEQMNARADAMKEYEHALELDPEIVQVRLRLAEMLLNEKQPLEALPHLERLRKQYPERADVIARLGQCRFLQGQTDEARQLLTTAVGELPNDQQLLLYLGKLELQDNHPAEAEKWLRRANKLDPGDTECLYTLVSVLQLQGRQKDSDEMLEQYKKTKQLLEQVNKMLREEADVPSRDAETAYNIGSRLLQIGQTRLGLYWLHQALNRDPAHQPTHRLLAEYYETQKDQQNAALHRRQIRGSSDKSSGETPSANETQIKNRKN